MSTTNAVTSDSLGNQGMSGEAYINALEAMVQDLSAQLEDVLTAPAAQHPADAQAAQGYMAKVLAHQEAVQLATRHPAMNEGAAALLWQGARLAFDLAKQLSHVSGGAA